MEEIRESVGGVKHPTRRNAVGLTTSMPSPDPEKRLRMVVLGASGVGKTQLVARFLGRPFTALYLPTAEEFHRTKYMIRGRSYQLDILDTSGQTMNPLMQNLTLLTGDLFMVVYSVVDYPSWERAQELVTVIEDVTKDPERTNKSIERSFKHLLCRSTYQGEKFANGIQEKSRSKNPPAPIPIIVIGSKCDLAEVKVQERDVLDWLKQRPSCSDLKLDHFVASAKTDMNVQTVFDRLFAMSHLPCEFSPNMHRKVSANSYVQNNTSLTNKLRQKKQDAGSFRLHQSSNKSGIHRENPEAGLSRGSWSDTDSEPQGDDMGQLASSAFATICPDQRRPSVDTEVLLAFAKVRSYSPENRSKNKHSSRHKSPLDKLKKQMLKLKFSSR